MTVDSIVAGSVVAVALGAFKLVQFIVSKQGSGNGKSKKTSVPPAPDHHGVDHGPCRESVKELTVGLYGLTEDLKASLNEQRTFRQMFGEWLAREEGRREMQREITGQFRPASPPR